MRRNIKIGGIIIFISAIFLLTGYSCSKEDTVKVNEAKELVQEIESFPYSEEAKSNPGRIYELFDQLLKIGNPAIPVVEEAIEKTKNKELGVMYREILSKMLVEHPDSARNQKLIKTLQDKKKSPGVRGEAALTLGQIGGSGVYEALAEALSDEDEGVRSMAASGLGCLRDKRATQPLISLISRESSSDVRRSSISSLGYIQDREAEPTLIALLSDPDWLVQGGTMIVLGEWKSQGAVPSLIQIAKEQSNKNRVSAIENLGKIGGEQAVNVLIEILNDKSEYMVMWAGDSLAMTGDQRAVQPIIAAIRRITRPTPKEHLKQAYKTLTGQEYQE